MTTTPTHTPPTAQPLEWLRQRDLLLPATGREWAKNVATVTAMFVVILTIVLTQRPYNASPETMAVMVVLYTFPTLVARAVPELAIVPCTLLSLIGILHFSGGTPLPLYVVFCYYLIIAYGPAQRQHAWNIVGVVVGLLAAFIDYFSHLNINVGTPEVVLWYLFLYCTPMALAWALGRRQRDKRTLTAQETQVKQATQQARATSAQLAVEEERTRIARDVHDVVAHSLALIVAQAEGGHYAGTKALPQDPTKAAELTLGTLETIGDAARASLKETRTLVSTLREGDSHRSDAAGATAPATAPQPGLEDIAALAADVRASGVDVTFTEEGSPGDHPAVPQRVQVAAYRIAQEGLTNMMKHAGPGATGALYLCHRPTAIELQMVNTVTATPAQTLQMEDLSGGNGILGMQERARSVGGTVAAERLATGEFVLFAQLPVTL